MPRSALEYVEIDHCVPLAQIPALIAELVMTPVPSLAAGEMEVPMSFEESAYDQPPSAFTCPDCNGTLWEVREGELLRYQCRVGHAYSADSMVAAQDESVERALWAALRSLEENADLARRMAESARRRQSPLVANRFDGNLHTVETTGGNLTSRWSVDGRGNYWDGAVAIDLDGNGVADLPHRELDLFGGLRRDSAFIAQACCTDSKCPVISNGWA